MTGPALANAGGCGHCLTGDSAQNGVMQPKHAIAAIWAASLLFGAAAIAGPAAGPARANDQTRLSYVPEDSVPRLRPAILGSATDTARATPPVRRHGVVQLGAYRTEADAAEDWAQFFDQAGGLLSGLKPRIISVHLPGRGHFYRLRAGPVRGGPNVFCQRLKARGVDCIPVRG